MTGELKKMQIIAFSSAGYEDSKKVDDGEFFVAVNPETYAITYEIEYGKDQAPGTSNKLPKFNKMKPQIMDFTFLFDSSGVLPGTTDEQRENGIKPELDKFQHIVSGYNGESHSPHFLQVIWGSLLLKCVLTKLTITYKLFKSDGLPIRASAKATFQGLIEDNLRLAEENNSSPDLTHVRVAKQGDTLPLMCEKIYGDRRHYLEVARHNKLINFRKLNTGQQIEFPPLEKV